VGPPYKSLRQESGLLRPRANSVRSAPLLCCYRVPQRQRISCHRTSDDGERKTAIQPMAKAMKSRRIPESDSVEELARFWDTHDLTDFEDLLENVPTEVFKRKSETVIPIRLRRQEAEKVKRVAKTRGVQEATLIRQWVREKLRNTSS
jgi:predicted DNA binding CopG/RHH family protein